MTNRSLTSTSSTRLLALAVAAAFALGACGSSSDGSSDAEASTETTASAAGATDDSTDAGGSGEISDDLVEFCEASAEMTTIAGPNTIPDGLEDRLKATAPAEVSAEIDTFFELVDAGDLSDDELIDVSRSIGEFHQANCV